MQLAAPPVRVGRGRDGTLIYSLALGPEELPPVRARDVEAAWDSARCARPGRIEKRAFRFEGSTGSLELALGSDAARRWAVAADGVAGLHTCRGVSLCLRLIALMELFAHAPNLAPPRPTLLRTIATARLTADGQLDLERAAVVPHPGFTSGAIA